MGGLSTKAKFLKGGLQLAFGQLGQQGLLFLRNILVARLLPPEQFGVALTFITVLSALDALSDVGIELYLTRSHGNDDPDLQATLQLFLIIRGGIAAIGIFLLAEPIATLFGAPDAVWAYRALALVPLVRGFLHLDTKRYERHLRFWPGVVNNLTAVGLGTMAAVALAFFTRGFEAILVAYLVQYLSLVIGSRVLSEQPYRLARRKDYAKKLFSFGTPLILNGMLLFAAMQGDRILVGAAMGPQELANYGVVAILTAGVTAIVMRVTSSLYVPMLAKFTPGEDSYLRRFQLLGAATMVVAVSAMAGFAMIGLHIATLAFGAKYAISSVVVVWLGIQSAFKIFRSWRQFSFIASARTTNVLVVNIAAATGIAAGAIAIRLGYGADSVARCMAAGEILAACVAVVAGSQADPRMRATGIKYAVLVATAAALLVGFNHMVPHDEILARLGLAALTPLAIMLAAILLVPALKTELKGLWNARIKGGIQ